MDYLYALRQNPPKLLREMDNISSLVAFASERRKVKSQSFTAPDWFQVDGEWLKLIQILQRRHFPESLLLVNWSDSSFVQFDYWQRNLFLTWIRANAKKLKIWKREA